MFGAEVNAAKAHDILVTGAVRDAVAKGGSAPEGIAFEPINVAPPGAREAFRVAYPR